MRTGAEICSLAPPQLVAIRHLPRRERNRVQKYARSGLMVGTDETIYRLEEAAPLLRPELRIAIAQPGLSKGAVSAPILQLLAST